MSCGRHCRAYDCQDPLPATHRKNALYCSPACKAIQDRVTLQAKYLTDPHYRRTKRQRSHDYYHTHLKK